MLILNESACATVIQYQPTLNALGCIWELPGNYPVFNVVISNYRYDKIIWIILIPPKYFVTYMIMKKYYPGEPVNINIQSLIDIIQQKNWLIATKG